VLTSKNVHLANQIGNPFISVSTTYLTYPFNLSKDASVCNHTPGESRLGCMARDMHLLCHVCYNL